MSKESSEMYPLPVGRHGHRPCCGLDLGFAGIVHHRHFLLLHEEGKG